MICVMVIKLLGIGKSENYSCYIFPKEQAVFPVLREFLQWMHVPDAQYAGALGKPLDHGEPLYDAPDEDIAEYIDYKKTFENEEKDHIDIIFGSKKVFLIINTAKDKQQEISKFFSAYVK